MWALRVCWLLLGTLSVGSAQLLFEKYPAVEIDPCNTSTVILPCNVTNLNQHDASLMFVTWKYQDKVFFSFDGVDGNFVKNSTFQTANFLDRSRLHNGIATLVISIKEALPGNYSCEVVESNREGKTTIELIYSAGCSNITANITTVIDGQKHVQWFLATERFFIIGIIIWIVVIYWCQFIAVAIRFDMTLKKKIALSSTGLFISTFIVTGIILVGSGRNLSSDYIGLSLAVFPMVFFVPLLYFLFTSVFEKQPLFTFVLLVLKALGYVIAVVGFALCVTACLPKDGSVLKTGLILTDVVGTIGLVYIFVIIGTSLKDHQPPRIYI